MRTVRALLVAVIATLMTHDPVLADSVESPSGFDEGYHNAILLGVFPTAPIASLTVNVDCYDTDHCGWGANCEYFGPGPAHVSFQGKGTVSMATDAEPTLTRSQAVLLCEYFTHEPGGPLSVFDYFAETLVAHDEFGAKVAVRLCVLGFDPDHLPEPPEDGCRDACGDAVCDGGLPNAVDALQILRGSVALSVCRTTLCDASGDGMVTAPDALRVLQAAVGIPRNLLCRPSLYCLQVRPSGNQAGTG